MSFQIEELDEVLHRIELSPPPQAAGTFDSPVNVYLLGGGPPALVNAGHPAQSTALCEALRSLGVEPSQVERILATGWEVDRLGGATLFPRADLFVLSSDMRAPRDLEMQVAARRRAVTEVATLLSEALEGFDGGAVEAFVEGFFPRMTRDLAMLPMRNGHRIQAAGFSLEVLATGGPGPGHMSLYEESRGVLFSGDFSLRGMPLSVSHPQAYLISLERMADLDAELLLPDRGRTYTRGRQSLMSAARLFNNFMTSLPTALVKAPTILEFIRRDRGELPEDPVELLGEFLLYQTLFEEIVRSRQIAAEGEGAARRYGVDVKDHREELR